MIYQSFAIFFLPFFLRYKIVSPKRSQKLIINSLQVIELIKADNKNVRESQF